MRVGSRATTRHDAWMVRTGKRASALAKLLQSGGSVADVSKAKAPRVQDLDPSLAEDVLALYRDLGGALEYPPLRPGAWDLSTGGLLIELDEELHFNRYRRLTLARPWAQSLPWARPYEHACDTREVECLRAATWGKRWSSDSSARMFGPGASPGNLDADGGSPRWKQRALYDAMKDAVAAQGDSRVVRLSVYDDVSGVPLGAALEGRQSIDVAELMTLVASRTNR